MKPRWRKVLHDLIDNKARTLLVVFSIAVGVFSIGVIAGAYQIISNDISISYSSNKPANIEMRMTNFGGDTLTSIQNQKDVADAEGRRVELDRIITKALTKDPNQRYQHADAYGPAQPAPLRSRRSRPGRRPSGPSFRSGCRRPQAPRPGPSA